MGPLNLDLYAGEVLGFAGLLGSGRTETAYLLFGVDKPDGGSLRIGGKEIKGGAPADFIKQGVALCPEDRKVDGIVDDLTIRENIIMALQASNGWLRHLKSSGPPQSQTDLSSCSTSSPLRRIRKSRTCPAATSGGDPGPLAGDELQGADPGRADQGHRHWGQGRNSKAGAGVGQQG